VGALGAVADLWRFPVKSLQGQPRPSVLVGPTGIVGDRAWAVRDLTSGAVLSAKRDPALLLATATIPGEGVLVELPGRAPATGAAADALLSELVGRPVRLHLAPAGAAYVDDADLHLVTRAELAGWDVRRFRPNVVIDGADTLDDLVGARLDIGPVRLDVVKPTKRCNMTTAAQPGLAKDVSVLRTLARDSALCRGVYARVVSPGRIAVGDAVVAR
jgi:uncharacterized protein YcbX